MPRGVKAKAENEKPAASTASPQGMGGNVPLAKNGTMAIMLAGAAKSLKKPQNELFVPLDDSMLRSPMPHIPTGSIIIDYLIGGELNRWGVAPCPGLPRGRITQMWGHESSGKSTFAIQAAANVCARGGTVLYIDWEHEFVPDYAAALGVPITNPNLFQLSQPETLEDGIRLATIAAVAGIDLIVFDSVGSPMTSRHAARSIEEIGEQDKVADLQLAWSRELPGLKKAIIRKGTAILAISQVRAVIASGPAAKHGPSTKPQGGNAWKFFASVRLELRRIKDEKVNQMNTLTHKSDERVIGGVVLCKVVKCKLSKSQGRQEVFYIRWGEGIDDLRSVMEIAIAHGVIDKGGAWLSWNAPSGPIKVQGVHQLRERLLKNPEDFKALYNAVLPFLGQAAVAETDLEELDDALAVEEPEPDGPDQSGVDDLLKEIGAHDAEVAPKPTEKSEDEDGESGE